MAQKLASMVFGFTPQSPAAGITSAFALGSVTPTTDRWFAYSWVPPEDKVLSKVMVYVSAGTSGAFDWTCGLHADASGLPSTEIETVALATSPASGNWAEFTGFTATAAVTGGTRYWLIWKAQDTTAYPSLRGITTGGGPAGCGDSDLWGTAIATSTNAGVAWTVARGAVGPRVEYTSGFHGFPASIAANDSTNKIQGVIERGVVITTPSNVTLNVRGVGMALYASGAAVDRGDLQYRIYNGTTLVATTLPIPAENVSTTATARYYYAPFAASHAIAGGSTLRIVAMDAGQASTGSNAYCFILYGIQNSEASLALMPFGAQVTQTTDSTAGPPATWAETSTNIVPFALVLDSDGEFTAAAGSGGLRTHPGMTGGMNG